MKTFTLEQQKEAYKKLPENVQEELAEINVAQLVADLGQKQGLHIDQIGFMTDVIMYTIINLLPSAEFNKNLKDSLNLDDQKINILVKEIDEQIFKRLKKALAEKEESVLSKPVENPLKDIVSKEDILKEIENPTPTFKAPEPKQEITPKVETKTEPIFKEETVKTMVQQKTVDPYREPVE